MIERYFKRSRRLWHEQKKWKLNRVIRSGISKLFESVKKLYGHYVRQLLMVQRNVRRMPQTCPRVLKLRMVRDILCSRVSNKKDVPHMVILKESNSWPNSKTNKSDQTYSKFIILFKNGPMSGIFPEDKSNGFHRKWPINRAQIREESGRSLMDQQSIKWMALKMNGPQNGRFWNWTVLKMGDLFDLT